MGHPASMGESGSEVEEHFKFQNAGVVGVGFGVAGGRESKTLIEGDGRKVIVGNHELKGVWASLRRAQDSIALMRS